MTDPAGAATTGCDLDRLMRMAARTAAPDEVEQIRDHLDECAGCAATLRALLDAERAGAARPDDRAALVGTRLGRFTIGGVLGHGNMGTVFTARDPELDRDVAIKVLGAGRVDERHADRLVREAKAMAQVRHAHVVMVHQVDRDQDVIFVAMELIRGPTLRAALTTARPPIDVVLDWLLQIANGLDAIHAAGLVHRDLKPDNIFVEPTASGHRVVVGDFGLAGASSSDDGDDPQAATSATSHAGTPAYMAPEQLEGDPASLRSDVFAFGVTAWEALTGRRPSGRSRAHTREPVELHAPGIADELIAILGKAMAPRPEDRYASARELAAELGRFQRGERVAAHRYSAAQLVRRWIRSHRAVVAVAAVAVVALIALGAISVRRILREQALAEDARGRAEAHRADAEELMAFLLGDLHDKLAPLGKLDLLEAPARKALAYYDKRADALDDRDQRNRAAALANLGAVLLAGGNPNAALPELRAALAIRGRLAAVAPGDAAAQRALASSHRDVGQALALTGDLNAALAEHRAALELAQRVAAADPDDLRAQRAVAASHQDIGTMLRNQSRLDDALVELRAALPISQRLAAAQPDDAKTQRDLSISHDRIGSVLEAQGALAEALVEYRASVAILSALAAREPANTLWQNNWAASINRLGDVLQKQGDARAAIDEYRKALEIRERLAAQEPTNGMFQQGLWTARIGLANGLLAAQDFPGAIREYRRAVVLAEANVATDPNNAQRLDYLMMSHHNLGAALLMSLAPKEAQPSLRAGCEIAGQLVARDPSNGRWQVQRAGCLAALGEAQFSLGDVAGAIADYRSAIAILDEQRARAPTAARESQILTRTEFAEALVAGGQRAEALAQYHTALEDAEALAAQDPSPPRTAQVAELRALIEKVSQPATSRRRAD
ncbi:MAG: protein kinase domain-containing protein [Kofleriaceae bacterium]